MPWKVIGQMHQRLPLIDRSRTAIAPTDALEEVLPDDIQEMVLEPIPWDTRLPATR